MRNFNLKKQEVSRINNLVANGVLTMMRNFKARKQGQFESANKRESGATSKRLGAERHEGTPGMPAGSWRSSLRVS